jgi:hypothetical protein
MGDRGLQLVAFAQAGRLKEAGFDWDGTHVFFFGKQDSLSSSVVGKPHQNDMRCPTVALALKWARDVKGIFAEVSIVAMGNVPVFAIGLYDLAKKHEIYFSIYEQSPVAWGLDRYGQAESALLDAVLDEIEGEGVQGE